MHAGAGQGPGKIHALQIDEEKSRKQREISPSWLAACAWRGGGGGYPSGREATEEKARGGRLFGCPACSSSSGALSSSTLRLSSRGALSSRLSTLLCISSWPPYARTSCPSSYPRQLLPPIPTLLLHLLLHLLPPHRQLSRSRPPLLLPEISRRRHSRHGASRNLTRPRATRCISVRGSRAIKERRSRRGNTTHHHHHPPLISGLEGA